MRRYVKAKRHAVYSDKKQRKKNGGCIEARPDAIQIHSTSNIRGNTFKVFNDVRNRLHPRSGNEDIQLTDSISSIIPPG